MIIFVYSGKFTKYRMWWDFFLSCLPTVLFFIAVVSERWRKPAILAFIIGPILYTMAAGFLEGFRRNK